MRAWIAPLALILAGTAAQAETADVKTLTIAVRSDAQPMAWKDAHTGHYRGYLWQLCLEVAARAGYHVEPVDITSTDRAAFLGSLPSPSSDGDAQPISLKDADIICDPMTLTLDRLARLTKSTRYRPSPIVFVASSSFAAFRGTPPADPEQRERPTESDKITIHCSGTDEKAAEAGGFGKALDRMQTYIRVWPKQQKTRDEYRGSVRATTRDTLSKSPGSEIRICNVIYDSHADLARDFCAGKLDRYYGDIEIVRDAIRIEAERIDKPCEARFPAITGATTDAIYEPYVLLISEDGNLHAEISQAIYSMYSDGTIEKRLNAEFPDKERWSPALKWLVAINQIPSGQATPPH